MSLTFSKKQGGHLRDLPVLLGGLAAATAATAVTRGVGSGVATAVTLVDEQKNDDDQQNPVAIVPAEQIAQTHVIHPLFGGASAHMRCRTRLSLSHV